MDRSKSDSPYLPGRADLSRKPSPGIPSHRFVLGFLSADLLLSVVGNFSDSLVFDVALVFHIASLLMLAVSRGLLLLWLFRIHRTMRGSYGLVLLRHDWAVVYGYFLPVLNLYLPFRYVDEIDRGLRWLEAPDASRHRYSDWKQMPTSTLVFIWWLLSAFFVVLWCAVFMLSLADHRPDHFTLLDAMLVATELGSEVAQLSVVRQVGRRWALIQRAGAPSTNMGPS